MIWRQSWRQVWSTPAQKAGGRLVPLIPAPAQIPCSSTSASRIEQKRLLPSQPLCILLPPRLDSHLWGGRKSGKVPLLIWAPTPAKSEEDWICPGGNSPPHLGSMYQSSKNRYCTFTAQDCTCFNCKICLLHGLVRPDTISLYRWAEVARIGFQTPQWWFLGDTHEDTGRDCARNKAQTMYTLV